MSFWDIIWFIIVSFAFVAYLMVMFAIISDLFRDHRTSGFAKAVWVFCLIFLPLLTSLAYLIFKGKGMAERQYGAAQEARQSQQAYIRDAAGQTPAEEITKAKALRDAGSITDEEYAKLKSQALSGVS